MERCPFWRYLGAWPLGHALGRWRGCSHPPGEYSPFTRALSRRLGWGHARRFRTRNPTRSAPADSPPPTYSRRKHAPPFSCTWGGARTLPSTWKGSRMEASPRRYGPWISRRRRRAPADSGSGSGSRGKPALHRVLWLRIHTGHGSRKSFFGALFSLTQRQLQEANLSLRIAAGATSVALGIWIIYELSFTHAYALV